MTRFLFFFKSVIFIIINVFIFQTLFAYVFYFSGAQGNRILRASPIVAIMKFSIRIRQTDLAAIRKLTVG